MKQITLLYVAGVIVMLAVTMLNGAMAYDICYGPDPPPGKLIFSISKVYVSIYILILTMKIIIFIDQNAQNILVRNTIKYLNV